MSRYEVVFETALTYTVYVDADDADEAQDKAFERKFPGVIGVPQGFEVNENWFIDSVTSVDEDD